MTITPHPPASRYEVTAAPATAFKLAGAMCEGRRIICVTGVMHRRHLNLRVLYEATTDTADTAIVPPAQALM